MIYSFNGKGTRVRKNAQIDKINKQMRMDILGKNDDLGCEYCLRNSII
jgi:hypothetical protein